MIPGFNPRQMQGMMSKLGIKQEEIQAKRVIIEKEDSNIIIENPQVIKIDMKGNESFQITGDVKEEQATSEEDIKQVIEKTQCSKEQAIQALKTSNGDLAEAILSLS